MSHPISPVSDASPDQPRQPVGIDGQAFRGRWQTRHDLKARPFAIGLAAVIALATLLRVIFPTADPPWRTPVGVVWHDEGAWTHNARNRALFGVWQTDNWNPIYIAPVFTGLEYVAFSVFGVGLWQARSVSMAAGIMSVWLMGLGVARAGGRTAGLLAAGLLATNYVWVMYSRAALMEATLVAFMVAGFYAVVRAQRQPAWGLAAGVFALLAYFTKASAAAFVAALGVVALASAIEVWWRAKACEATTARPAWRAVLDDPHGRATLFVLAGLALAAGVALAVFVVPHWADYRFYNWQMSVTRKPSYTARALVDRLSWFPVVHDIFTRMWFTVGVGTVAAAGVLARLRAAPVADRLLVAWLGLGALQLVLHDVGNERRFVALIPAFVGLAALALGRDGRLLPDEVRRVSRRGLLWMLPVVLAACYLLAGGVVRLAFLYDIGPSVRWSALVAVLAAAAVYLAWPRLASLLAGRPVPPAVAAVIVAAVMGGDLVQFGQYAHGITFKNVEAMRLVAERLPPGTLVHGKLANGLALESRIRPVFVGNGFGNYDDRFTRDDARYILTYVAPYVGYEGRVIREVLDAYPRKRLLWTVPVAESGGGADLAALFDKHPDFPAPAPATPAATDTDPTRAPH